MKQVNKTQFELKIYSLVDVVELVLLVLLVDVLEAKLRLITYSCHGACRCENSILLVVVVLVVEVDAI